MHIDGTNAEQGESAPLVQAPCNVNADVVPLGERPRSVEVWRVTNNEVPGFELLVPDGV